MHQASPEVGLIYLTDTIAPCCFLDLHYDLFTQQTIKEEEFKQRWRDNNMNCWRIVSSGTSQLSVVISQHSAAPPISCPDRMRAE